MGVRRVCLSASIALALAAAAAPPSRAATPPSVAVRTQAPEVEKILQELEAKAAAADGTWRLRAGRQNAPSDPWTFALQGPRWALESEAAAPSPHANVALYADGAYVYSLHDQLRCQGGWPGSTLRGCHRSGLLRRSDRRAPTVAAGPAHL